MPGYGSSLSTLEECSNESIAHLTKHIVTATLKNVAISNGVDKARVIKLRKEILLMPLFQSDFLTNIATVKQSLRGGFCGTNIYNAVRRVCSGRLSI